MMVSQNVTGMADLNEKKARLKSEAVKSESSEWCSVRGVSVTEIFVNTKSLNTDVLNVISYRDEEKLEKQ